MYLLKGLPNSMQEQFTGALRAITTEHGYIHQGIAYIMREILTVTTTASSYIDFTTPADKTIHFRPSSFASNGDNITIEIFEDASVTGGTTYAAKNRNRNSNNTSQVSITINPTVNTEGNIIDKFYVGGGSGISDTTSGAITGNVDEWVLKPDTTYLIKITNNGASDSNVFVNLFWYEE